MATPAIHLPPLHREERWQAPSVDATAVQRTLDRLWAEVAEERRHLLGRPRSATDGMMMRTRTLNLVVVVDTVDEVEPMMNLVLSLTEFFPSRTVILVREPSRHTESGLDVSIAVEEHSSSGSGSPIRFETIVVSTGRGPEEVLASVAAPILVPELPDFVLYPAGSFIDSSLFSELIDVADRVVVDTSRVRRPAEALQYLAGLHREHGDACRLSDAAWRRLTPWRQMVAQFFDVAIHQPCLSCIDSVHITFAERDELGRSGLTSALLMVGWLCTRLGWRAPGEELVRTKEGWRLTLRAGAKGSSREVVVTLASRSNPDASASICSIHLDANGDAPGIFRVERISPEGVRTLSDAGGRIERTVYVRPPDDRRILSAELREFGRDPIYADSLAFAANLWPEGTDA